SNSFYCRYPIIVGVGGADFVVMASARVEVVVDALDSSLFEDFRLLLVQESEASADVNGNLLFDPAHHLCDLIGFSGSRASPAGDHAVPDSAGLLGLERSFQ